MNILGGVGDYAAKLATITFISSAYVQARTAGAGPNVVVIKYNRLFTVPTAGLNWLLISLLDYNVRSSKLINQFQVSFMAI